MEIPIHIYRRMAYAVPAERKGDLDKSLSRFAGDYRLLEAFLDTFGSDDPWEAAEKAHLRRALWRSPREAEEILGISQSGHKLTRELYVFAHSHDPTRTWISGSQAITRILEIWGTDQQREALTPKGRKKIKSKKKRQMQVTMQEFAESLEEVLQDPWKVDDVQSTNERHQVRKILEVDELQKYVQKLHDVVYGNTAFLDDVRPSFLLALDPGGTFMGRLERKKAQLPQAIRDIYTTVVNSPLEIPEQERRFLVGSLLAWCAMDIPVRRDAALSGYQQDLDFILKLPESHPIIQTYGKPDLTKIVDILDKSEITLMEAAKVFDAYPVNEVRREFNKAYFSLYQQEADAALQCLESCFLAEGQWREDSVGDSVPLQRLRETTYAAVLDREDFWAVRNLLRVKTLAPGEKAYQTTTLGEWKQMIDGIVVANRKLRQLNLEKGEKEGSPRGLPKKQGDILKGRYRLAEDIEEQQGFSLGEILSRIDFLQQKKNIGWSVLRNHMIKAAELRLYLPSEWKSIEYLLEEARELQPFQGPRPETVLQGVLQDIRVIEARPFALPTGKYATVTELQEMEALREVELFLQNQPGDAALVEIRDIRVLYNFEQGPINLVVSQNYIPPTVDLQGVKIVDQEAAVAALREIQENYTPTAGLSLAWQLQGSFVFKCPEWLRNKVGLSPGSWESGDTLLSLERQGRIHRDLIQFVETTYGRLKEAFTHDVSAISIGAEKLAAAELYQYFKVEVVGLAKEDAVGSLRRLNYEAPLPAAFLSTVEIAEMTGDIARLNKEEGRNMKMYITRK